jgi:Ice-binding-like
VRWRTDSLVSLAYCGFGVRDLSLHKARRMNFRNSGKEIEMKRKFLTLLASVGLAASLAGPSPALAQVSLGTASNFAVLGGAGVTCTGSAVNGDVGSLLTVTGFPPPTPALCTLVGTVHAGDAATTAAFSDFLRAHDALDAMPCDAQHNLTGQPLGGKTLAPGVYCFNSTADLTTGTLTLDGRGNSNAVWVFQVETAITTGTASVVMANGGRACNVFWELGTAATIGTGTAFLGNVLAGSAITFTGTNSSLVGRALAVTAVTMTGTNVSIGNCGGTQPPPPCKHDKHDKRDKHDEHDMQKCDGDHDGHDRDDDDDKNDGDHHNHGG